MTKEYGSRCSRNVCHDLGVLFLVPADPLNPRRADEYFASEAAAAKSLGWEVDLIDHDALGSGDAQRSVQLVTDAADDSLYRGWMIRSEHYGLLEAALETKGVRLRTKLDSYRRAHEFPGWYPVFRAHTAQSVWMTGPGTNGLLDLVRELPPGPAIVKDWVKSMKHYWNEAAYVPDVRDPDVVMRVAERFLELRDEDLVGGIVIRCFEEYEPGEVRSWWVDGKCIAVTAHPDTPDTLPPPHVPVELLTESVNDLKAPFVTVDLAHRASGDWRVIEVGDGQVSDRPPGLSPDDLLRSLSRPS